MATVLTVTTRTDRRSRAVSVWHAVLVYALIRLAGLAALAVTASAKGRDAHSLLVSWDGQWYRGIAANGYGFTHIHPDGRHLSDYAFFPMYPMLERVVSGLTGLDYEDAGLAISWVSALCAVYAIFRIAERLYDARVAFVAVILWGALPIAIVQTMSYTESFFTAMAAWSLYFVLRRRWLGAAGLAVIATLTRPTGSAVALAVIVAAAVHLWSSRRRGPREDRGGTILSPVIAIVLAAIGSVAYVAWVGVRTGSVGGYFTVTAGWKNSIDGGVAFTQMILAKFDRWSTVPTGLVLVAAIVALPALYYAGVRRHHPLPLLVYTASLVALSLVTSGYFGSKPRYLLPGFPLLFPIAAWLVERVTPGQRAMILSATTAVSIGYGAAWLLGSCPP